MTLLERHWRITDANGFRQVVRGPGVVGEQPTIRPGEAFRYASGCPLTTPSGVMVGEYRMVGEDGQSFEVAIPAFSLDSPDAKAGAELTRFRNTMGGGRQGVVTPLHRAVARPEGLASFGRPYRAVPPIPLSLH